MGVFASDSFTDTDGTALTSHTPDVGGSWVAHSANAGSLEISSNRCRVAAANTQVRVQYNNGAPGSADYYVQAKFRRTGAIGAVSHQGIWARLQTGASSGLLFGYDGTGVWSMYKWVTGTFTQLGSSTSQTLTLDQDYTIKINVSGQNVTVTVDGSTVCGGTASDGGSVTGAGKAGIRMNPGSAQTVALDDFQADDGLAVGSPWYYYQQMMN